MNTTLKNINNLFQRVFWIRYPKDKRGFVLVLTLMLITLMSVLAITSFEMVIATIHITDNHKRYLQSLYAADAGVEHTVYVLKRATWSGISYTTPSTLQSGLDMDNKDEEASETWTWVGGSETDLTVNKWTMTHTETGNNYSVIVKINNPASDNFITVESTGTESSFPKTVIAEVVNSPSVRILRWREREM